jgi:hypothetical protein
MSNLPIVVNGSTPSISINVGNYVNGPILVLLSTVTKKGTTVTIRDNDGLNAYPTRFIRVSTTSGIRFEGTASNYINFTQPYQYITTTTNGSNIWKREVPVIQGLDPARNSLDQYVNGYGTTISSMIISSFSTNTPLWVQGSTIIDGLLVGYTSQKSLDTIVSLSTHIISTGGFYASTLKYSTIRVKDILIQSTATAESTIGVGSVFADLLTAGSTNLSTFELVDRLHPTPIGQFYPSSGHTLWVTIGNSNYMFPTFAQSGWSNTSTNIGTQLQGGLGAGVSSMSTFFSDVLVVARWDIGLSSFSTQVTSIFLGTSKTLSSLSTTLYSGLSNVNSAPGLSSLSTILSLGLSSINGVPGGIRLSNAITNSFSNTTVEPGFSTLSTVIAPAISSLKTSVPLSSFSTLIAPGFSTVAAFPGASILSNVTNAAMSSVAYTIGLSNLSTQLAYSLSTINTGIGLSTLSANTIRISSIYQGDTVSSLSSQTSYGLSTIAANLGFSSLVQTLQQGVSTVADRAYLPYQILMLSKMSQLSISTGVSSLSTVISRGISTVNFGPGLSSISSFFPRSLSTMDIQQGMSTLSTAISRGLSDVNFVVSFPIIYSTISTLARDLILSDTSNATTQTITIGGTQANPILYLNGSNYFTAGNLQTIMCSTITTDTMEIDGTALLNSMSTSSLRVTGALNGYSLSTGLLEESSTILRILELIDRVTGLPGTSNITSRNSILSATTANGATTAPVFLTSAPGLSTLSSIFGYGQFSLNQGVEISSLSTAISQSFSTINFIAGVSSMWSNIDSKYPYSYKSTISTPYAIASTASFVNLFVSSLSTAFISTQQTIAFSGLVSTMIVRNLNVSSLKSDLYPTSLITSTLKFSTLSTGVLSVFSTFEVSSLTTVSQILTSTFSSGSQLFTSSIGLFAPSFSTLLASTGSLSLNQTRLFAPQVVSTFSVGTLFVSTVYASTFVASTAFSSFTIPVNGLLSSGVNTMALENVSVRAGITQQNWGLATVGAFWSSSVSSLQVRDIWGRDSNNRPVITQTDGADPGQFLGSTFAGSTLALMWDGRKLYATGDAGDKLVTYIAPPGWSNNYNGQTQVSNSNLMWLRRPVTGAHSVVTKQIEFNGSMYIAVGQDATSAGAIKYSFDGFNFSNAIYPSYSGTGLNSVAWNGSIWVATGDVAIQYSFDGINWRSFSAYGLPTPGRKIVWGGKTFVAILGNQIYRTNDPVNNWYSATTFGLTLTGSPIPTSLSVTPRYLLASFYNPAGTTSNWAKSYDHGATWVDKFSGYSNENAIVNATFDGQSLTGVSYEVTQKNMPLYLRHLAPRSDGTTWLISSQSLQVQGQYTSLHTPFATHSNVIPSFSMSNLAVHGSTFHIVARSTNTIVGFANSGYGDRGNNQHLERMNYLEFNNTLKILGHLSTQVFVEGNIVPNTINTLPRGTLDVGGVTQTTQFVASNVQLTFGAPYATSTVSATNSNYGLFQQHAAGIYARLFAAGYGPGGPTNYHSTPQTYFDVNCASNSYVLFRESVFDGGATMCNAIKTRLGTNTDAALIPAVSGLADGKLWHIWRAGGTNYSNVDTGATYFTGQHPTNCLDISFAEVDQHVGELVATADQGYTMYDPSGNQITGQKAIFITSATPITKRTTIDKDPNVFGVVTNTFNGYLDNSGNFEPYTSTTFTTNLFGRIMVNSIGEGAIWVTNYNGSVQNGDYLCSCPIPGLSRKQDDKKLWNYTVAKATMSCDFNPGWISSIDSSSGQWVSTPSYVCEDIQWNGSTFKKAFIGCTYHCG